MAGASGETKMCAYCGHEFVRQTKWTRDYFARRKACSRDCPGLERPSVLKDYEVTTGGCWNCLGRMDKNGYGKAYDQTRPAGMKVDWSHRVYYRAHVGPIPDGHELDHTCENTRCINPDHLDPVTRVEHVARTFRRLGKDGEQQRAAVLRQSGLTYAEIAAVLGLTGKQSARQRVMAAIRKGLVAADDIPPSPYLSETEREDVRAMHKMGIPQTEIAAWLGVDSSNISRLLSGARIWEQRP